MREGKDMSEIKAPESCMDCRKYIYKGDDEQYCQAMRMREIRLLRWQKKPKWCPIDRMAEKRKQEG